MYLWIFTKIGLHISKIPWLMTVRCELTKIVVWLNTNNYNGPTGVLQEWVCRFGTTYSVNLWEPELLSISSRPWSWGQEDVRPPQEGRLVLWQPWHTLQLASGRVLVNSRKQVWYLLVCKLRGRPISPWYAAAAAAKSLQSCPTLCNPQTAAHQAPLSLGFSRQEHWSGLPFPSPMHESEKWKWSLSVVSDS